MFYSYWYKKRILNRNRETTWQSFGWNIIMVLHSRVIKQHCLVDKINRTDKNDFLIIQYQFLDMRTIVYIVL